MNQKAKIVLDLKKVIFTFTIGVAQCLIFTVPYISFVFYKPLQNLLQCTNEQIGFLLTLYGIVSMISSIPGGWLADRINPKKLIISGLLITCGAALACVLFVNYKVYMVMWLLMSVGGRLLFWAAGIKSVRLIADPNEQGKAFGYAYFSCKISSTVAQVIGLALVASVLGEILGFKSFIVMIVALLFINAILVWKLMPSDISSSQKTADTDESDNPKVSLKTIVLMLKNKEVWLFSIIVFCLYSQVIIGGYFTPYFSDVMNLSAVEAGSIFVFIGAIAGFCGSILGTISDRIGSTLKIIVSIMSIALVLLLVLVYSGTLSLPAAITINLVFTVLVYGIYGICDSTMEEIGIDRKMAGTCIGIVAVIGGMPDVYVCTMFGNWIDKYQNAAYKMIFTYGASLTIVAMVASLFLLYSKKKKREISCVK